MSAPAILAAVACWAAAVFFVSASTANLEEGKPLYPTSNEKAKLLLSSLAMALTFIAGIIL